MITLAMLCVMFTFGGGALYGAGMETAGLALGMPSIIALGILFAHAQMGMFTGKTYTDALTVGSLKRQLSTVDDGSLIYLANPDIAPVVSLFTARLDGHSAVVLERADKEQS